MRELLDASGVPRERARNPNGFVVLRAGMEPKTVPTFAITGGGACECPWEGRLWRSRVILGPCMWVGKSVRSSNGVEAYTLSFPLVFIVTDVLNVQFLDGCRQVVHEVGDGWWEMLLPCLHARS